MSDPQITDLDGWIAALTRPAALTELAVLALCVAAAWVLAAVADRAMGARDSRSILFGRKIVDGVLFPVLLLLLAYLSRALLMRWVSPALFLSLIHI